MKKLISLYLLLLIALCATAQSKKTYAVVVGISGYQNKAIPQLKFSDRDAGYFIDYLQNRPGSPVPDDQIKKLLNEEATIASIYDALDWLKESCKQGDTAYLYFSGHGDLETRSNFSIGYLLAYNSPANNYRNNAIKLEDINTVANTLSVKNKANVILITDACHSGKLAGDFFKGKQFVAEQLRLVLNNEVRLTACGPDQLAAEGQAWGGGRGVFSYYLLSGLYGKADISNDGAVQLKELSDYIDKSVKNDKTLKAEEHKQDPVIDGHPAFPMAAVDLQKLKQYLDSTENKSTTIPASLAAFKKISDQPIDIFFRMARENAIENVVNFKSYGSVERADLPAKIVQACIDSVDQLTQSDDRGKMKFYGKESLDTLLIQLRQNPDLVKRFNERLIQLVHDKGQDMINAYLGGDLAELEKRQYYYSGKRQYRDHLPMLATIIRITPEDHSLYPVLKIQQEYLAGLICRMEMATGTNTDSLLQMAFYHQRRALELEPYAAYIHNELGNLQLHLKKYDSADYHYGLASTLAPTWAVPWSNRIRMYNAMNDMARAKQAIHMADSLQHNLSFVMMNAGLIMEKDRNLLAAKSYYLKAIDNNKVHFLPYERLGFIYLDEGDYYEADRYFLEASTRKDQFALNESYFEIGVELGGFPLPDSVSTGKSRLPQLYKDAAALEKQRQYDKAIAIYDQIIVIENQLQTDQALYKGYPAKPTGENLEDLIMQYEIPVHMGGALKKARLYEQLGQYEKAESTLLKQIAANRSAAELREKTVKASKPGTWLIIGTKMNYFYLNISSDFESEARNFYQRMITLFPRDQRWFEKAGMFLYKRLDLAFANAPVEKYEPLYRAMQNYAYPWMTGEAPREQPDVKYILPGTGEEMIIQKQIFDPISEALANLEQAEKFSATTNTSPVLLEAMGDLAAWMGDRDKAINYYKRLVTSKPADVNARKKYIDYLTYQHEYPEAVLQLEVLAKQNKLSRDQKLDLANYYIQSDNKTKALPYLRSYKPQDTDENMNKMSMYARIYLLDGNLSKALSCIKDSVTALSIDDKDDEDMRTYKTEFNASRYFSVARIQALSGKNEAAMKSLEQALNTGFKYAYVLKNDPSLAALRKTEQWKMLMDKYPIEDYSYDEANGFESLTNYTMRLHK